MKPVEKTAPGGAGRGCGPLLSFEAVAKVYASGRVRALDGVSLALAAGEMVAVTGASGSGKSTLLHLAGALAPPDQGRVLVDGVPLCPAHADRHRSRVVGFVFQHHCLLDHLTARENVEVPMVPVEPSAARRRERARELLARVGLGAREDHLPAQLSGGEAQRVGIARALANRPRLLLMDEPTGELDSGNGARVMELVGELNARDGVTILLVTHDRAVARLAPRNVVLADGRIAADLGRDETYRAELAELGRSALGVALRARDEDPRLAALGLPEPVKEWLRGLKG